MSNKLKLCKGCEDPFEWHDNVIIVDDKVYHDHCLYIFPLSYGAEFEGRYLGETENDDGNSAFEVLGDGEYLEDES